MEKHSYVGKTKEEAIQLAKEELQEVEENLFNNRNYYFITFNSWLILNKNST